MNPAILSALLRTVGRAAAFLATDRVMRGSKVDGKDGEDRPSAREMAERIIASRRRDREAMFSPPSPSATIQPQPSGERPPVQPDPQEQKEKSLRQRLTDVIFSQSEAKRGQIDRDSGRHIEPQQSQGTEAHHVIGRKQAEEEEDGIQETKKFSEKLREGAAQVANFLGPIGKAGVAVVGFVKGLELMNMGVLALNRDLAQFNGQLAAAYAQFDVDEMQRSVYRSEELSGPLSELAAAQSELRDSTNRVGTQVQGVVVGVLTKVTEAVNWLNKLTGLTDGFAGYIKDIREWLFGQSPEPEAGPWQTFFNDVQDGKFDGKRPVFVRGSKDLHNAQDMKDIFG
jgi:hypothetical protein